MYIVNKSEKANKNGNPKAQTKVIPRPPIRLTLYCLPNHLKKPIGTDLSKKKEAINRNGAKKLKICHKPLTMKKANAAKSTRTRSPVKGLILNILLVFIF